MAVDLNELSKKLKKQKPVGVNKDGQLTTVDPKNDGSKQSNPDNSTTLEPKRFFV